MTPLICTNNCATADKYFWLERACGQIPCNKNCKELHSYRTARWARSTDVVGEIQCCSDKGECTRVDADNKCFSGDTRDQDTRKYSYLEAKRICAQNNKRLCTKAELLSENAAGCCNGGCQNDGAIVWTSDSQDGLFITTCILAHTIIWHHTTPVVMFTSLSSHCVNMSVILSSCTRALIPPVSCREQYHASLARDSLKLSCSDDQRCSDHDNGYHDNSYQDNGYQDNGYHHTRYVWVDTDSPHLYRKGLVACKNDDKLLSIALGFANVHISAAETEKHNARARCWRFRV